MYIILPRRMPAKCLSGPFVKLRIATFRVVSSVCLRLSFRPSNRPSVRQLVCLSVCLSVCLLLNGFSWYLKFEDFSKVCRENSSFIEILPRIKCTLHEYVRTFMVMSQFFLEREMIQTKVVEIIKRHTVYIIRPTTAQYKYFN